DGLPARTPARRAPGRPGRRSRRTPGPAHRRPPAARTGGADRRAAPLGHPPRQHRRGLRRRAHRARRPRLVGAALGGADGRPRARRRPVRLARGGRGTRDRPRARRARHRRGPAGRTPRRRHDRRGRPARPRHPAGRPPARPLPRTRRVSRPHPGGGARPGLPRPRPPRTAARRTHPASPLRRTRADPRGREAAHRTAWHTRGRRARHRPAPVRQLLRQRHGRRVAGVRAGHPRCRGRPVSRLAVAVDRRPGPSAGARDVRPFRLNPGVPMADKPRRLILNANLIPGGTIGSPWRRAPEPAAHFVSIEHYLEVARVAERGKLDAVFLADSPDVQPKDWNAPSRLLDPFVAQSVIAAHTSRIGLIVTATTSYNDPYNLARAFASLASVSDGRAGW